MGRKRKHAALSESTRLLVDVLAGVDALWWPDRRKWELRRDEVVWERRRAYREHGIDLPGGGNQADRQHFGRLLGELERAGLLVVSRSRGRRVGVKLTAAGDAITRVMVAEKTVAQNWHVLQHAQAVQARVRPQLGERASWPEHFLAEAWEWQGTDEQNAAMKAQILDLVPFLPLEWITFSGDTYTPRKHWCTVTDAGLAALQAGPPPDAPQEIEFDQAAGDYYDDRWAAYGRELDAAAPEFPNNIVIPLPFGVGCGSLACLIEMHTKKEPAA